MDKRIENQIEILDSMVDLFRELNMKETAEFLLQTKKNLVGLNSKLYDTVGQCSMNGKCFNESESKNECCMNPDTVGMERKIEDIDQSKILDNSNKMLAEAMDKHSDKIPDFTKRLISIAMDENDAEKCRLDEKTVCKNPTTTSCDELKSDSYTSTHMFNISIESDNSTYSFNGSEIIYFYNEDNTNNIHTGLLEKTNRDFILPMFLDNAMFNKDSFTIRKEIYDKAYNPVYAIVYDGCRIVEYKDPGLDSRVTELRVFDVEFDYEDYHYEKIK